jgi:phosphatidylinositol glycan class W
MINLSYALWMISCNLMQVLQFMLLDMIVLPSGPATVEDEKETPGSDAPPRVTSASPSMLLDAINANSLPFFLLCNLCTGAVNLSMQTLFASDALAMLVLSAYTLLTCTVIVYVNHRGWRLKL